MADFVLRMGMSTGDIKYFALYKDIVGKFPEIVSKDKIGKVEDIIVGLKAGKILKHWQESLIIWIQRATF